MILTRIGRKTWYCIWFPQTLFVFHYLHHSLHHIMWLPLCQSKRTSEWTWWYGGNEPWQKIKRNFLYILHIGEPCNRKIKRNFSYLFSFLLLPKRLSNKGSDSLFDHQACLFSVFLILSVTNQKVPSGVDRINLKCTPSYLFTCY